MKKGEFGTIVPRFSDIVKIDGEDLIDVDGDIIPKELLEIMRDLRRAGLDNGSLEIAELKPRRPAKK